MRKLLPGLNGLQLQGKHSDVGGETVPIRVEIDIQGALIRRDRGSERGAALRIFAQAAQPVFNFLQGVEDGAAVAQRAAAASVRDKRTLAINAPPLKMGTEIPGPAE